MKSIFHAVILAVGLFSIPVTFAQSCGSGGGATVCLSANGSTSAINLSWTVSGSITKVEVYRDTDSNPTGRQRIAVPGASARAYADSSAVAGTQYWYWVKFNATGGAYNSGSASAIRTATCPVPSITPYLKVGSTWTQTGSTSIASGGSVVLGPQAIAGGAWANGTWSWSGCGTSGSSREQTLAPAASCTATATFTDSCNQHANYDFKITVAGWANVKMGGGGYVPGVIYHPTVANLRYARTDVAGVYRWDNNNSQWLSITDGFGPDDGVSPGAESVALDPSNANWVAMSTNMAVSAGNGKFVYSNDQGNSWSKVNLPFPVGSNNQGRAMGERMVADPNLPSALFYATRTAGLWKSTDKGLNWTQVSSLSSYVMSANDMANANGGSPIGVEFVVFDTTVPTIGFTPSGIPTKTIYVGVAPDYKGLAGLSSYLYKSTDGGVTWTGIAVPSAVTSAIAGNQLHIPHLARAADGALYVPFTSSSGPGSGAPSYLYKFDGGTTWTQLTHSGDGNYYGGIGGLSVYGSGASTNIVFGVSGTWGDASWVQVAMRSMDGGQTWAEIGRSGDVSGSHNYHDASGTTGAAKPEYWGWVDDLDIDPFNPDHVSYVVGGGVWSTNEAFSTPLPHWNFDVNGIEEMVNLTMTAPPPNAGYLLASGQGDTGLYVHTSLNGAPTRSPNLGVNHLWDGGNGTGIDMAWNNPAFIAAVGTFSGKSAGAYSTDSGQTWALFPSTPSFAATTAGDETRVAVTADGANIIWAIRGQVPYYSTNKGSTWVATNLPAPAVAYHIKADRKNPLKVYAYEHGGNWWYSSPAKFYYSTDGGHTFTASAQTWSPNGFNVTDMAVNPFVDGDIWLADSNNLWHSVNSGVTWTKFTAMASSGVNAFSQLGATEVALGAPAAGSSYSAAVYFVGRIGGVYGVYKSDDVGNTWARIDDDNHRYSGISGIVADTSVYGRVFLAARGMVYNY